MMAHFALRASLALAASLLVVGCRSATQIEVQVTTDLPCGRANGGASLTSGTLLEIEGAPPTTTSRTCTDGKLGSVVLVPSDADDAKVAFKVIAGIDGQDAEECKAPNYGPKCIVARRALRFEAHTPLTVPVTMRLSCAGIACDPTQTCVQGACVDATIDPSKCEGSGCGESALGGEGGNDGGVDATLDAPSDGTVDSTVDAPTDGPASDAPIDAPIDSPVQISDGAVLGCDLRGLQPGAPWPMHGYCPGNRAKSPFVAATPSGSSPKWRYPATGYLPGAAMGMPLIAADGTIYVATSRGIIDAITPAGAPRWHRADDAGPAPDGYDGYRAIPALAADGTLRLFNCGTYEYVALDPADGGAIHRAVMGGGNACMRGPTSIGPDGVLYAPDQSGYLYAVRSDGTVKWSLPSVAYDYVMPAITPSGTITTQSGDGIFRGLADNSNVLWTIDSGLNLFDTFEVATDGKTVRLATQTGDLYAFGYDVPGGRVAWKVTVEPGFSIYGVSVDDDGTTYVGADDGIHAYDPNGDAGYRVPGRCGRLVIDGAGKLVGWCDGEIKAFDPHGAATSLWDVPVPPYPPQDGGDVVTDIYDTPTIGADGTVYVAVSYEAPGGFVSAVYAFGP
jgi:hypothetical protein